MINEYKNLNTLIKYLKQAEISLISFVDDTKISKNIQSILAKNNINVTPLGGGKTNNYVMLSEVQEKNFNETINKVFSLLDDSKYISLPIVLETEYKSRDDFLKSLLKNCKVDIAVRIVESLSYSEVIWIKVNLKKCYAIVVSGNSNVGKTNLVSNFRLPNLKIISGDSILEQISKRAILSSEEMFEAVHSGYEKWDWSISIKEINKTTKLRQEFVQIISENSGNHNFIFEMWTPDDLLADIKSHFIQKKFHTWSLTRVESIEMDPNFRIKELEETLDDSRLHIKELEETLDDSRLHIKELEEALDDLRLYIGDVNIILEGMVSSKSWKATQPLRNFKTFLNRFII
jgi:hypothetical protein